MAGEDTGCQGDYLTFTLGGRAYGIDVHVVQEIAGQARPKRLPNPPAHVLGAIDLRGVAVPVVDLHRRLALEPAMPDAPPVVIVVRVRTGNASRAVGLAVDAVSAVRRIAPGDRSITALAIEPLVAACAAAA